MAHILLIEPNTILARTYQRALEHAGHQIRHARGAQDAIYEADAQSPDVVVLELQLAAHDGIEFLHEFRSYPEWLHVPVVLHTYVTPAALAPVLMAMQADMGVVAALYKPQTSLAKLLSSVNAQVAV
jgi:CheY-like chemotaxis protein